MASKPRRRPPRRTCGTPWEPNAAAAVVYRCFGALRRRYCKSRATARQLLGVRFVSRTCGVATAVAAAKHTRSK